MATRTSVLSKKANFHTLFDDLRATRSRFDSARRRHESLTERVDLHERLHELRAELARARQGLGL